MGLEVTIDVVAEGADAAAARLREVRARLREETDAEIWVTHDDFPALCALVNGQAGWLMYLRHDGDAGFSSRNPDFRGDPGETLPFVLGCGQVDRYPASWTYPPSVVLAALERFAATGKVPPEIRWHNDSLDGLEGPDDPRPPIVFAPVDDPELAASLEELRVAFLHTCARAQRVLARIVPNPAVVDMGSFTPSLMAGVHERNRGKLAPLDDERLGRVYANLQAISGAFSGISSYLTRGVPGSGAEARDRCRDARAMCAQCDELLDRLGA